MVAYDPSKDMLIRQWRCDATGLYVGLYQYKNGEPKIQIGPRVLKTAKGEDRAALSVKRLNYEDLCWLSEVIEELRIDLGELIGVDPYEDYEDYEEDE